MLKKPVPVTTVESDSLVSVICMRRFVTIAGLHLGKVAQDLVRIFEQRFLLSDTEMRVEK